MMTMTMMPTMLTLIINYARSAVVVGEGPDAAVHAHTRLHLRTLQLRHKILPTVSAPTLGAKRAPTPVAIGAPAPRGMCSCARLDDTYSYYRVSSMIRTNLDLDWSTVILGVPK